ncbi:hypothetical protein EXIGLDRAFT_833188 [Exidia glandulosa HHB12029]|uniref:Uncharacterized protein n=1 Tax=Exidia glandulosa HHB12029 TaxID=1314781 RepID=A0A166B1H6_EXIGL|nr:hypothetical protein EXIGLDRAFT_833188 [Exidia glandulosa HHB12029]
MTQTVQKFGRIESIVKARADILANGLGWRYNVKWLNHPDEATSWLTDSEIGSVVLVKAFWANLVEGLLDKDFEEGDMVYASNEWLLQCAAKYNAKSQHSLNGRPDEEDHAAFSRRKPRASPPKATPGAPGATNRTPHPGSTPLKQQKLDFSKMPSSSASTSRAAAASTRIRKEKSFDEHAIVISSDSDNDNESPSRGRGAVESRINVGKAKAVGSQGGQRTGGTRGPFKETQPLPSASKLLRRLPPSPNSRPVYNQTVLQDVLRQRMDDETLKGPRPTDSRYVKRSSPPPAQLRPSQALKQTLATIGRRKRTPPSAGPSASRGKTDDVLDLCTPSPEPEVPTSSPQEIYSVESRPNRFSSFAYKPTLVLDVLDSRPAKRQRTSEDSGYVSAGRPPTIVSNTASSARARTKHLSNGIAFLPLSTSRSQLNSASSNRRPRSRGSKTCSPDPEALIDLTSPPKAFVPLKEPPQSPLVPNGLLRHSPLLARIAEDDELQVDHTPPTSHLKDDPGIPRMADDRTPLSPNGLLSSPLPVPHREDEKTPLKSSEAIRDSSPPPPSSHLSGSRQSSITMDSDDDDNAFFRSRRTRLPRRHETPRQQDGKENAGAPLPPGIVEYEFEEPESYREVTDPPLGDDELSLPPSYRTSFALDIGETTSIPVRLRDVCSSGTIVLPRRVVLDGAGVYGEGHVQDFPLRGGAARVVPNPSAASVEHCEVLVHIWRVLRRCEVFIFVRFTSDDEWCRGIVLFAAGGTVGQSFGMSQRLMEHRNGGIILAEARLPAEPPEPPESFHYS